MSVASETPYLAIIKQGKLISGKYVNYYRAIGAQSIIKYCTTICFDIVLYPLCPSYQKGMEVLRSA